MDALRKQALREVVERCRALTDDYILQPCRRECFGPEHLRRAVMTYLERPAKRLRPAIVLLSAQAMGGDVDVAVPAAAAVELYHTWTLVHDDVIDGDALRRGLPTVHVEAAAWARRDFDASPACAEDYGRDVAILAGDALHGWSVASLLGCAARGACPHLVLGLARRLTTWLTPRLLEGEMLDVQFSHRPPGSISAADIMRMMQLKTGALLEFSASAGAAIAVGKLPGDAAVDALGRYASLCGIAFQLQDDILGIVGTESELGKPIGSDIREGKATLLVHHALAALAPAARRQLTRALGNREAGAAIIADAISCIRSSGAVEVTQRLARKSLDEAIDCLHAVVPESPEREHLRTLARMMLDRGL